MNSTNVVKVLCVCLIFSFFGTLGFLSYCVWENVWWKYEVTNLASYEGATRARQDFQAGKLRLFEITGKYDRDTFTGSNTGPFQVWYVMYSTNLPYPLRYSTEEMVMGYNARMRLMQKEPARYLSQATDWPVTRNESSNTIPSTLPPP